MMNDYQRARVPDEIARHIISARYYAAWAPLLADFAWLRANAPLGLATPDGYDPFWVVTKRADIMEISGQPALFHSDDPTTPIYRGALISQAGAEQLKAVLAASGQTQMLRSVVAMDPPEHSKHRLLTFDYFAPKGIKYLEDEIRVIARECIDEMANRENRCDFARDIAMYDPMRVILRIFGLPRSDEGMMLRLTQHFFNPSDADLSQNGAVMDDRAATPTGFETLMPYYDYFDSLTESRRRSPKDDLASTIANGVIDGKLISKWDATSYYITVLTAGHDTTSSSLAGGIWALAEHRDQWDLIKNEPASIPTLIEECIRWVTPINHFMRIAARDYELRGQRISAGDWIMLSYVSGNRDEGVFDNPDVFYAKRQPNRHIAFGFGAHACLGQNLARMELRIFFEELFSRIESISLDGPPSRNAAVFVGGIKSVPLKYQMK